MALRIHQSSGGSATRVPRQSNRTPRNTPVACRVRPHPRERWGSAIRVSRSAWMSVVESGGDQAAAGRHGVPPVAPADRQVRLANERTYLAWGRTSLAFFALALAVGRIVPELERSRSRWRFEATGCAYAALGVLFALYGLHRHRVVQNALPTGGYAEASGSLLAVLSILTAIVGVATFVVLLV